MGPPKKYEDTTPVCKCGMEMLKVNVKVLQRVTRKYKHGAGCDGCQKMIDSKKALWHCIDDFTHHHPEGYDLCLKCGAAQTMCASTSTDRFAYAANDDQKLQGMQKIISANELRLHRFHCV